MRITCYSLLLLAFCQFGASPSFAIKNGENDNLNSPTNTQQAEDIEKVVETNLKFRARTSDPSTQLKAQKELLRFYQSKHDHYAAARVFDSLTDPLHDSLHRVVPDSETEPQDDRQGQNKRESSIQREIEYEFQEAQDREYRSFQRARADEVIRKSSAATKDLSNAATAALQLVKLNQEWSDYLHSEGMESEALKHQRRAREFAIKGSSLLAKEGIELYRCNRIPESLQKCRDAEEAAPQHTHQQLAAANNILFPLEKIGNATDIWNAKHHAFELRFKLEGTPIPEDFDGDTPDQALENKLLRHNELENLLRYYQERHNFEKARNVLGKILDGVSWTEENKVQRHLEWAQYCDSEGQTADALNHRSLADRLQKRQLAWRKQDEARKKREEEEQRKLAEKERKEQEVAFRREQEKQAAAEAKRAAMSAEEKAKAEEAKRLAEERLKQRPELIGQTFTSEYGGALTFVDQENVDIHTALQELKRTGRYTSDFTNFGDLPDIMPATYKVVGSAPDWKIRIQSVLKGSPRIDNYSFFVDEEGKIKLVGGATPLPTVLRGGKAF